MIAVLQSLLVTVLSLLRVRWGFYCFIFLLPFMPRYLGLAIGTGSLSARRIIMILLSGLFFIWIEQCQKWPLIFNLIRKSKLTFLLLFSLFLIKLVATLLSSGLTNALYVMDDFLFSIPIVIISMLFIRADKEKSLLVFWILLSFLISELLSFLEFIRQAPLLQGIIDFSVYGSDKVAVGRLRNEMYRSAALFDNPLLLSEFLCLTWPMVWHALYKRNHKWLRLVALGSLLLMPLAFYCIGSRSAWLVFFVTVIFMVFIHLWTRLGYIYKAFALVLCLIGAVSIITAAIQIFTDPNSYLSYFSTDNNESQDRSTLERITQFSVVLSALKERPLLGYGMQQNFANDLDFLNNLDNYWLRLGLEGGFFGVITFLCTLFVIIQKAAKLRNASTSEYDQRFLLASMGAVFAFSCYKFFLSMPANNIYFYLFVGIIIGWILNEFDATEEDSQ